MVGVIMLSGRAHTRAFRVGQVCQVRAGLTGDNPIIREMIIVTITINMALAQIPISTFSHIWAFVQQYGVMFVIIVIIIIIIIIIYRKVKVVHCTL